ncbi:MAG: redoxin domain-containing protein [Candidatus Poribacteria bacterium]|nr:redoxin domain-containing protein [Candidatus Poribacteria bacterium]
MSDDKHQQDLVTQIKNYHRSGEFDKALEISNRVLKSDPPDLEAYDSRWRLIAEMFSEEVAKKRIVPEIETLLRTQPETSELLYTACWGYKKLPGRAKNVPNSLFDKMLQYPKTKLYLTALLGLAQRSEGTDQEWHYYQRIINECTVSDGPSSWYMMAYEKMLKLVEQDRDLASDDYIDELIDGLLKAHLFMCRETQQFLGWAYIEAVERRLKFNNRLDKALEILERAEIRLEEKEEQTWLVENNEGSVEGVHKDISRLRAEIHLQQGRWREAYDGLLANAPDFLESLWTRFKEDSINYFYMLGRSAEGIGEWEPARHYYANASFAPTPHTEGQVGLERVYQQMARGETTDTFEAFLKETEAEYRIREDADRENIRQKFITNRLNEKATDFRLETLEGETYTLSEMLGKVVLLDVGASWCGPCNMAVPQLKLIYEHFSKTKDFVIWGVNDGETPQQVRKSLDEHQPPWPVLLDPTREVAKAYKVRAIPKFIFIDRNGYWQYNFGSSNIIDGQPLIWLIEALLSD